jgi:hypothetical protein
MKNKQAKQGKKKPAKPAERKRDADSDDVERAVYDGMQDLRAAKKPGRA